jgi:hypothetical protein
MPSKDYFLDVAMPSVVRHHPFLLVGLLTLALFAAVGALSSAGHTQAAAVAEVPLRVLIIPMYAVWLAVTILYVALNGTGGTTGVIVLLFWIAKLIAGFVPYALADHLLFRSGRRPHHPDAAN